MTQKETVKVRDGWAQCPVCKRNRRLLRVEADTRAEKLLVYCRSCKTEIALDIDGQNVERVME